VKEIPARRYLSNRNLSHPNRDITAELVFADPGIEARQNRIIGDL
jgi:hypothetical protein